MRKLELLATFETGAEAIDRDHREIIDLANGITERLREEGAECCGPLFDEFIETCQRHFEHEEAFLSGIGFPRLEKHRGYHADLLARAEAVAAACSEILPSGDLTGCFDELAALLVDDIIRGDTDFISFLKEKAGGR